jgi:uncharacterized protein (TIGR00299 family) protein
MRIAYFDCFAGVSGDMTVGALLSAGMPIEYLRTELEKLPLQGFKVSCHPLERSMIVATKFDVDVLAHAHHHAEEHEHALHAEPHHPGGHAHHPHLHDDGHHHHDEFETHVHAHGMNYAEIVQLIEESDLSKNVIQRSKAIFHTIGVAEAKIHGATLESVHFHEVGMVDSIVDIVSTAIGLDYFHIEECRSRVVPLGKGGTINTAHGIMPIPPPATIEILKQYPTELGSVAAEMTTPTGAAIIKSMSKGLLHEHEHLEPVAIGYGAGTKDFREVPNLLRIVIGELLSNSAPATAFPESDHVIQFTTVIDDMPANQLAYIHERLFEEGALEAYLRPIVMKKGRAGHELVILCSEPRSEHILSFLARETTTLGVRTEWVSRRIARRAGIELHHPEFGPIRAKEVDNGSVAPRRLEPEFEDVKRISRERGLPIREVYERLLRDLR